MESLKLSFSKVETFKVERGHIEFFINKKRYHNDIKVWQMLENPLEYLKKGTSIDSKCE